MCSIIRVSLICYFTHSRVSVTRISLLLELTWAQVIQSQSINLLYRDNLKITIIEWLISSCKKVEHKFLFQFNPYVLTGCARELFVIYMLSHYSPLRRAQLSAVADHLRRNISVCIYNVATTIVNDKHFVFNQTIFAHVRARLSNFKVLFVKND